MRRLQTQLIDLGKMSEQILQLAAGAVKSDQAKLQEIQRLLQLVHDNAAAVSDDRIRQLETQIKIVQEEIEDYKRKVERLREEIHRRVPK